MAGTTRKPGPPSGAAQTKKKKTTTKQTPSARSASRPAAPSGVVVLVGTRKGAWFFHGDKARKQWRVDGPHFLGHIVHHMVLDPRDGRTVLVAAKTGHLGPTVFRSSNGGKSFKEASRPPAFAKAVDGQKGRTVDHTFWLTPGHPTEPKVWYAGTSPQGLFRSEDGGDTWVGLPSINDDAQYRQWMGTEQGGTPDGPKLHSVLVDPRDPSHLYFAMSSGGVHESTDGGLSFSPLVDGLEVVDQFDPANLAFHDPHCVRLCPTNPDRLYQQNHCGVYRLDRPATKWERIGKKLPKSVGDVGFGIVVHPRTADVAWVLPMDGTSVWPRTSPAGKPSLYVTRNAGKSWTRQDAGLPESQAWWTVKRQAMAADEGEPVNVYFGTTGGQLWMGRDEGQRFSCIAQHLPEIYSVETALVR
jgi:hypothetical protein